MVFQTKESPQFLIDFPVVQVEQVLLCRRGDSRLRCVDRFMRHEACSRFLVGPCAQAQGQGLPPAIRAGKEWRGRRESDSQMTCHPIHCTRCVAWTDTSYKPNVHHNHHQPPPTTTTNHHQQQPPQLQHTTNHHHNHHNNNNNNNNTSCLSQECPFFASPVEHGPQSRSLTVFCVLCLSEECSSRFKGERVKITEDSSLVLPR